MNLTDNDVKILANGIRQMDWLPEYNSNTWLYSKLKHIYINDPEFIKYPFLIEIDYSLSGLLTERLRDELVILLYLRHEFKVKGL